MLEAILRDPGAAPLPPRSRALVDYAVKLTLDPHSVCEADITALRAAELSDRGIHDAASIVAYYNYVNRMASGLGVQLDDRSAATGTPEATP